MYLRSFDCTECATEHDPAAPVRLCRECAAPLRARYDLGALGAALDRDVLARRARGLWRWRELLPLAPDATPITLGEGDTPLLELPRLAARFGGIDLRLKDESQSPTGSFKDRGMTVAVSLACAWGRKALAAPSAGNAGGALAAYGARAGLPVHLAMPADVPHANRLEAEVCGAHVHLIDGTIADCGRWIAEHSEREGWWDVSTLKEPGRVEGKKTMGLELAEQLGWRLPAWILYPTGGGTGLVGMVKAFEELRALGWVPDAALPRMVAVQAEGCAPIVAAFSAGETRAQPPAHPHTIAAGLRVPSPVGDRWMLRDLRRTDGRALAVSDADLMAGARMLATEEGVFAAPETGALVAALEQLVAAGDIPTGDIATGDIATGDIATGDIATGDDATGGTVVLFNTASGLKYAEAFGDGAPATTPA